MKNELDFLKWREHGGPAFPFDDGDILWKGQSVLDVFACHAMQGIITGKWSCGVPIADPTEYERTAQAAYRYAFAMLAEREKHSPDNK